MNGWSGSAPADTDLLQIRIPQLDSAAMICVAFSGGLDSTVLLHLLAMQDRRRVRAIHVHHGLQSAADDWAVRCAQFCERLGVAFDLRHVAIDADDPAGPEAAARNARYRALRQSMRRGDCLTTAHHRSDQAETLLLRLLRGAGIHGMAAMRPFGSFEPGSLWRPLLDVPRTVLRAYAEAQGLQWIEDPQNAEMRYTRSWLRSEIVPRLQLRFPEVSARFAQAARLAAEAADLLDELAQLDRQQAGTGDGLRISTLLALSSSRRHNLLRFWLREQGFQVPSAAVLQRFHPEVLLAAESAEPCLAWPGCEVRRYRDVLHAMAPLPLPPTSEVLLWSAAACLKLPPGCGSLQADLPPPQRLTVRFPQGGERFKPAGGAHTRTLKNLFQEAGVPPWVRGRTPLVLLQDELAFVAGIGGSARWADFCARENWQMRWFPD